MRECLDIVEVKFEDYEKVQKMRKQRQKIVKQRKTLILVITD